MKDRVPRGRLVSEMSEGGSDNHCTVCLYRYIIVTGAKPYLVNVAVKFFMNWVSFVRKYALISDSPWS